MEMGFFSDNKGKIIKGKNVNSFHWWVEVFIYSVLLNRTQIISFFFFFLGSEAQWIARS